MAEKYIISHDMGTSSNKAILVTIYGEILDSVKSSYPIYHPHLGFAEQDPLDWWNAICLTTRELLHKTSIKPEQIAAMTFSAQMQGLIPVSKDGTPLMHAMTWLDSRSADIVNEKLWVPPRILGYNIFHLIKFLTITGGCPGHTGKEQIGKILWLRKYKPEIIDKVFKFLDTKDFIIYKLTGNFVTSVDMAVPWWILDTRNNRNQWHPKLCKLAGITQDLLPEVKESAAIVGKVTAEAAKQTGLLAGTPIINGAGDLSAAALGSGANNDGELHIHIGTSGWVAGHFTKRKIDILHYAGCIGSTYPQKYYLGIAHQETAGACLEWLKSKVLYHVEQLEKEDKVEEVYQIMDNLADEAGPGAAGLLFTPWMFGERCPLDDDRVRAGLYNLGLNHSREHIIRAVFEGVAFNTRWAMQVMEKLYSRVTKLNIIGGGAKSNVWCQIMADVTNRIIHQVADPQQAGAKAVALLASMTLGFIESYHDIKNYIKINQTFYPELNHRKIYDEMFREFQNVYKYNKKLYHKLNKQTE